jgi:hypothetical protein
MRFRRLMRLWADQVPTLGPQRLLWLATQNSMSTKRVLTHGQKRPNKAAVLGKTATIAGKILFVDPSGAAVTRLAA